MTENKKFRILTSDLLIADVISPLEGNGALRKLVEEYQRHGKVKPDSKLAIDHEAFERFAKAVPIDQCETMPGGSSANTMVTLKKTLPDDVDVTFLGVVGNDRNPRSLDSNIRNSLVDAGITLIDPPANGVKPQAATSFVIKFDPRVDGPENDGKRAIATYPGNAKDLLRSSMITPELMAEHDAVFVQGSLWQKLHESPRVEGGHAPEEHLGFADKLLKLRWEQGKELWLSMPTTADFSKDTSGEWTHAEKAIHFRNLIKSANVILSNGEEMARVYTDEHERREISDIMEKRRINDADLKTQGVAKLVESGKLTPEEVAKFDFPNRSVVIDTAIRRLRDSLKDRLLEKERDRNHWKGSTEQVAFVTCGKEPGLVVTADMVSQVNAAPVPDNERKFNLGAGDTTFAGILTAHVKKVPPRLPVRPYERHMEIGMALAEAKLRQEKPSARVENPRQALIDAGWLTHDGRFEGSPQLQGPGVAAHWRSQVAAERANASASRTAG